MSDRTLHESAFGYLKPTDEQQAVMNDLRQRADVYAQAVDAALPASSDKTYVKLHENDRMSWIDGDWVTAVLIAAVLLICWWGGP